MHVDGGALHDGDASFAHAAGRVVPACFRRPEQFNPLAMIRPWCFAVPADAGHDERLRDNGPPSNAFSRAY